ncbi:sodium:solute symporter [Alteribacillus sp. YIM 98480]|uniref:sodium:solute symporter family protein n=1 Tax=Alteribacillus sp. YIM 98480 TaxID=2606599 RepID=UPI00131EBDCD|nr:sodium:solute symporter family protein [Alteribacillus sp. YIM 98480]
MNTISIIFWIFIFLYIGIASLLAKYIKNSNDFYVMSNRGTTLLITGTLLASFLSSSTFMGIAGIVYENGPPIFLLVFTSWIGVVLAALYTGRQLRASGCKTMPDFLEYRFGSSVRIIGTIIMLVGLIGYGLIQLMGAGVVLTSITGLSYELMIILFIGVLLIFGALGGMWAVIVTDTVMCITFIIATFYIAPAGIIESGGLTAITETLYRENPLYFSSGGAVLQAPIGWSVGQFALWALFMAAAPWLATRVLPAKNDFVVMKSAIWSILLATMMVTILYLGVFAVRVLNPAIDPPDGVLIWMAQTLVNPVVGGIGIAGIMAAILSTTSTIFIFAGFALSRDLYERMSKRELSDKEKIGAARISQAIIAALMLVIALMQPVSIYWIGAWAGALFAVSWLPVLVAGFHWKKANKYGIISSMIGGTISYILLYQMVERWGTFTLPYGIDPVIPAVIISCALLYVVSITGKTEQSYIENYEKMKAVSLNEETLNQFEGKRSALVKDYKSTRNLAIFSSIIAFIFFGYFIIEVALKV